MDLRDTLSELLRQRGCGFIWWLCLLPGSRCSKQRAKAWGSRTGWCQRCPSILRACVSPAKRPRSVNLCFESPALMLLTMNKMWEYWKATCHTPWNFPKQITAECGADLPLSSFQLVTWTPTCESGPGCWVTSTGFWQEQFYRLCEVTALRGECLPSLRAVFRNHRKLACSCFPSLGPTFPYSSLYHTKAKYAGDKQSQHSPTVQESHQKSGRTHLISFGTRWLISCGSSRFLFRYFLKARAVRFWKLPLLHISC